MIKEYLLSVAIEGCNRLEMPRPGMLDRENQSVRERFKAVFNSGDSEMDFRSRMVGGLSVLFSLSIAVLIIDDLLGGFYGVAAVEALVIVGMVSAGWCLLIKRNLDLAALLIVGVLLTVLALLLGLSGGSLSGGFVGLPAMVLLACVVCPPRVAVLATCAGIGVACGAAWLSTTGWNFPLQTEGRSLWLLARVSSVVSLVTLLSVSLYRGSAESIRKRATRVQHKLAETNSELSSLVQSHLASAQLMFKVQEIGDLIGWWYEPTTERIHYTASEKGEFRSFVLREQEQSALPLLNSELRALVAKRVEAASSWDDEARIIGDDSSPIWYRDSGQTEIVNGEVIRVVGVLQDITSTKTLTEQLEHHATFDELTGLYNRRSFWQAVETEYTEFGSRKQTSHLLFIDLDQFKLVNDTSGHLAGDRLLKIVARVLQENVHGSDLVGRVGGDEFGLIIRDCSVTMVSQVANRLREAIEQLHFHWSGETFRVGASIGVIGIDPVYGSTSELQQLVDAACYEAKLAGRNRVNYYDEREEVIAAHRGEARWVQRLHDAMAHDRFELHGQLIKPVVPNGKPDRVEVLIRLREAGSDRLIPPGAFLPAAERFGLSPKIDQWVLGYLLTRLHADPDVRNCNRTYWVNLSGNSIGDKKFAQYLIETMRNSTLPKGMVNFEITETAVIRNIEEARELVEKLRAMGCQFALDDFGSGLSSFGYLKKLPVDYLKIDGMFVREILKDKTDRVFVRAIINIAKTMGIKTVAEFVENDEIYDVVADFGVDYVQGYGVHRPERLEFYDEESEIVLAKKAS